MQQYAVFLANWKHFKDLKRVQLEMLFFRGFLVAVALEENRKSPFEKKFLKLLPVRWNFFGEGVSRVESDCGFPDDSA